MYDGVWWLSVRSVRGVGRVDGPRRGGAQRHPHRHRGLHPARRLQRRRLPTDVGGVRVGEQGTLPSPRLAITSPTRVTSEI